MPWYIQGYFFFCLSGGMCRQQGPYFFAAHGGAGYFSALADCELANPRGEGALRERGDHGRA